MDRQRPPKWKIKIRIHDSGAGELAAVLEGDFILEKLNLLVVHCRSHPTGTLVEDPLFDNQPDCKFRVDTCTRKERGSRGYHNLVLQLG